MDNFVDRVLALQKEKRELDTHVLRVFLHWVEDTNYMQVNDAVIILNYVVSILPSVLIHWRMGIATGVAKLPLALFAKENDNG